MLSEQRQATTFRDMRTKKTHPVAVRMEPEVKEALEGLAAAEDRSLSSYIARVLKQHVEQHGSHSKTKRPRV